MTGTLLDTVLDRTVVPGYTKLGFRIRSRQWNPDELASLEGKVVMVTGFTSGLGLAAAEGFARLGATVWGIGRSEDRAEQGRTSIVERSGNADVHIGLCDLSDLRSVRRFAEWFLGQAPRLDVLVNNAGTLTDKRELSSDGIELTLATNVLGPFLLSGLLLPLLEHSAPARILTVSSGGMYTQRIRVDDLQSERGEFDGTATYARTKRAQVILTGAAAGRMGPRGVVVHAMHPGWVNTPGLQRSLPHFHRATRPLLRTPEQGADTIVWLGAAEEPGRSSGLFWHDRRPRTTHLLPWTKETSQDRERLWAQCVRLSGCADGDPTAINGHARAMTRSRARPR